MSHTKNWIPSVSKYILFSSIFWIEFIINTTKLWTLELNWKFSFIWFGVPSDNRRRWRSSWLELERVRWTRSRPDPSDWQAPAGCTVRGRTSSQCACSWSLWSYSIPNKANCLHNNIKIIYFLIFFECRFFYNFHYNLKLNIFYFVLCFYFQIMKIRIEVYQKSYISFFS